MLSQADSSAVVLCARLPDRDGTTDSGLRSCQLILLARREQGRNLYSNDVKLYSEKLRAPKPDSANSRICQDIPSHMSPDTKVIETKPVSFPYLLAEPLPTDIGKIPDISIIAGEEFRNWMAKDLDIFSLSILTVRKRRHNIALSFPTIQ
ncbi:hypothetical protein TNCV_4013901 [Trichonephila clavipes]|nr:hypothetical protein TNCV_4013901 [Trichonephila clavipes]